MKKEYELPEKIEQKLNNQSVKLYLFMENLKDVEFMRKSMLTAVYSWFGMYFVFFVMSLVNSMSISDLIKTTMVINKLTGIFGDSKVIVGGVIIFSVTVFIWKYLNVSHEADLKYFYLNDTNFDNDIEFGEQIRNRFMSKSIDMKYEDIKRIVKVRKHLFLYDDKNIVGIKFQKNSDIKQFKKCLLNKIKEKTMENSFDTDKEMNQAAKLIYKKTSLYKVMQSCSIVTMISFLYIYINNLCYEKNLLAAFVSTYYFKTGENLNFNLINLFFSWTGSHIYFSYSDYVANVLCLQYFLVALFILAIANIHKCFVVKSIKKTFTKKEGEDKHE